MGSGISNLYNSSILTYGQNVSHGEDFILHESNSQEFIYSGKGSLEEKRLAFRKSNIDDNAKPLIEQHGVDEEGYFGIKDGRYRTIYSEDPVKTSIEFNNTIGRGGKVYPLDRNPYGTRTMLGDGSKIVHRTVTRTKDSPAVHIQISGSKTIPDQKIHFKRKIK